MRVRASIQTSLASLQQIVNDNIAEARLIVAPPLAQTILISISISLAQAPGTLLTTHLLT